MTCHYPASPDPEVVVHRDRSCQSHDALASFKQRTVKSDRTMTAPQRPQVGHRGPSRPPSAAPNAGIKRKERDYERDTGDETNINVVVRCRGRSDREVKENSGVVVSTTGVKGKNVELSMGPNAISNKTYQFDKVFSPAADQAIIYDDVVSPILNEMLSGYNCTIFAYGQTGTGKTYTMSGDMTDTCGLLSDAAGIIPRVLYSLFQKLEADEVECTVKCSFIELYNEELRDLLSPDDSIKLKIYDDANKKSHSATLVQGMEESHINSATDGIKLLQAGSHRRQVAATKCNDLSSRSHTVFTITTYVKKAGETGDEFICSGKLNLVDLAGSENIQRSGAENKRAAEAGLINKSLLTLGRVINALVDKSAHIPYRESKLTRLLQDSLGGRTKTCIIATVSPAKSNLEETISTLDYAFRAKNIRNKPQVNSMISKKTLLREFTVEIEKLKSELIATRQRNGVYLSNEQFEVITVESESRRILSEEQRARIETIEVSLRNKLQDLFTLKNNFTMLKKDNEITRAALEATKDVLEKTELVLQDTKQNLEEESLMRQAHAATETQLHNIGSDLITTVEHSIEDLDRVHAKLRRRSDLHRQNRSKWYDTTKQTLEISETVDTCLEDLQQESNMMLDSAAARIEIFISQEMQRALDGRNMVEEEASAFKQRLALIEEQSSSSTQGMNKILEEIKILREDVKAKVGEGLHGLSEAAAKISGEVINELDQFHTQLHSSYSGLGKEFKNLFEDLTKQLVLQQEESDRLRKALQDANRKSNQALKATANQFELELEAEKRAAVEEKDELLRRVSALITDSNNQRQERLSKALNPVHINILDIADEGGNADEAYGVAMDHWIERDKALLDNVTKSKEDLKSKMKRDWSAVNARNSAIQSSTKAIHQETTKIVDAQVEAVAVQMTALDDFVTRARQQNDDNHARHVVDLSLLSEEHAIYSKEISTYLDSSALISFDTDIHQQHEKLKASLLPLAAGIRRPLQDLRVQLSSTTMADYTPTGETPQRRDWTYPVTLPHTIPEAEEQSTTSVKPTTASTTRTPGKSPRKFASPRKTPRKQHLVRLDTPPVIKMQAVPATEPPKQTTGLKDLDINVTTVADGIVSSRLPTKSGLKGPISTVRELDIGGRQKENIHTAGLDGTGVGSMAVPSGLSRSMYGGRMLRSSSSRRSPPV